MVVAYGMGVAWDGVVVLHKYAGNPGRSTLLSFGNKRNMICFE